MGDFVSDLLAGERNAVIIAAAIYFAACGVFATVNALRHSRWPVVVGVLLEAEVARTGGSSFRVDEWEFAGRVRYRYEVDGVRFEGDRLSPYLVMATYNLRFLIRWQLGWIERVGVDGVRVRHHPTNPRKSYLIGVGWRSILAVAGLCFGSAALLVASLN